MPCIYQRTADVLLAMPAEMPEVFEAVRRAEGDASCTTGEIPHVIQQVFRHLQYLLLSM